MTKYLKSLKANHTVMALLFIVLGIVLCLWPGKSLLVMCRIFGWGLIIGGAVLAFLGYTNRNEDPMLKLILCGGAAALIIGIIIVARAKSVVSFIPRVIGILIILNGIYNLNQSYRLRKVLRVRTGSLVLAVLTIAAGIVIFAKPFAAAGTMVLITGIGLIYNGLSDLWVISRFEEDMKYPSRRLR